MEDDPEDNQRIRQSDERVFADPLEPEVGEARRDEPIPEPQVAREPRDQQQPQSVDEPAGDSDVV